MHTFRTLATATALTVFAGLASAVSVSAGGVGAVGVLTDLGSFAAGTYLLTGSGTVDLVGDGSFTMNPDGTPTTTVTTPGYGYFNPSGSYLADGNYGPAGLNGKIGALIGSFSAAPSSPADWFLIGYSDSVTLSSAGHIYASVNDTFHDNDTGAFDVAISAVPEPEMAALMLAGLAVVAGAARRRR